MYPQPNVDGDMPPEKRIADRTAISDTVSKALSK